MVDIQLAHTAALDATARGAIRALLDAIFDGDFGEHDWEHALGGLHLLARDAGGELVGHASIVQRRLVHAGRALRCGYVEAFGVRADRRRRGIGGALCDAIAPVIRGAYDLGGLSATDDAAALYAAHGWELWRGPTWALTPAGRVRTPDEDGGVYVLRAAGPLDLGADLTCDWRDGDVW